MRARLSLSLLALLALPLAAPSPVFAQDISARAYLSPGSSVGVGRQFVLNVEITGTQSIERQPELPDLSDFADFLGTSQQSSIRMVNGRTSITVTLQNRYQALSEGTYDIPAFTVRAGGQTLSTEPLTLTVTPGGGPASGGGSGSGVAGGPGQVSDEDLFVTAEPTKTRVLAGEPLVVEYRIWTRVDVGSYSITRVPEPQGFWVEDITPEGQPQVEQLERNGQQYTTAVIRRVALIPTGPGLRTVEPVGLDAQVRVRTRDPFDDFFGGSFFNSGSVRTSALSNPVTIRVDALPEGRPSPFSGVVGSLRLSASVDRDSVASNEAVTLTVRASGEGHISAIPEPELDLPSDFEVFPPEVSESVSEFGPGLGGQKTFEYVLIPRAPGTRRLGPFRMGYYDVEAGAYRMAESGELALTVSGMPTTGGGPALLSRGGVEQLREDIRFIHLGATMRPVGRMVFNGVGFWIVALLPLLAIGGALALRRHRDLLEGDVAYARGRRASRVARKRLAQARALAAGTDRRAFYAEVARALRGLVADRLNLAEAGLQTGDLGARLREHGVGDETVAETLSCLEHSDRQRFAPPTGDPGEEERFLERASSLMSNLDRAIR
ncbi:MAG: BatD family protein [Gemmatimonadota bacterium]